MHIRKIKIFLTSFLRYCKDIANLSGYFRCGWPNPLKKIVSTCGKLWCLSAWKKPISFFIFFLRYWKDIAYFFWILLGMPDHVHQIKKYQIKEDFDVYLHQKSTSSSLLFRDIAEISLFWVLWAWLALPTKIVDSLMLHAKNQFHSTFFQILQRFCKIVISVTLGMPGYGHQKQWNQLVEHFDAYFMQIIKFIPELYLETLLRYYKLGNLGILDINIHNHQKQTVYVHAKNQLDPSLLSWDITLKSHIWLTECISVHNLRTRILSWDRIK